MAKKRAASKRANPKKKTAPAAPKKPRAKKTREPKPPPPPLVGPVDPLTKALGRALRELGMRPAELLKPQQKRRAVLACIETTGHVGRSCKACGVPRRTFYEWLDEPSGEFRAAYELARSRGRDVLADAALERSVYGVERLKFNKEGGANIDPRTGKVYVERQFSDRLLALLLQASDPQRFASRTKVEHSGEIAAPIVGPAPRLTILLRDPGGRVPVSRDS